MVEQSLHPQTNSSQLQLDSFSNPSGVAQPDGQVQGLLEVASAKSLLNFLCAQQY